MTYTLQEQVKDLNNLISKAQKKKDYQAIARLTSKKEFAEKRLKRIERLKKPLVKGIGFKGGKKPKVSAKQGINVLRKMF